MTETTFAAASRETTTARAVGAPAPDAPLAALEVQRRAVGPRDVRIDITPTPRSAAASPGADHEPDDIAELLWRHHAEPSGFQNQARHRLSLTRGLT
jgi:hypothetical protein